MKVKRAVIPAAGLGTRVLPASKVVPKEMLPIVDKPAIQYIVEEAVNSGIEDILIVTNRGKGVIEDHFDNSPELEKKLLEGQKKEIYEQVSKLSKLANIPVHHLTNFLIKEGAFETLKKGFYSWRNISATIMMRL